MSISNPPPKEHLGFNATINFINMLESLKEFMDNPKALQELAKQASAAYSITDDMKEKHSQLLADALEAQAKIDQVSKDTGMLQIQQQAFNEQQAKALKELSDKAAKNEADYQDKSQKLAKQQSDLDAQMTAMANAQATLNNNQADLASRTAELDAREAALNTHSQKIAALRDSLVV